MMIQEGPKDRPDQDPSSSTKFFSFLVSPDSYLLGASLLSGLVSLFFILLNIISIQCIIESCSALQDESNTLGSWLIFESLTTFFVLTSLLTGLHYRSLRSSQKQKD
jgi:hypothetical protein